MKRKIGTIIVTIKENYVSQPITTNKYLDIISVWFHLPKDINGKLTNLEPVYIGDINVNSNYACLPEDISFEINGLENIYVYGKKNDKVIITYIY